MSAENSSVTLTWTGPIAVDSANQKKEELLDAICSADIVYLDIAQCTDLDAAGLQVLIAARAEAAKRNKKFYIHNTISPEIMKILGLSGVSAGLFFEQEQTHA